MIPGQTSDFVDPMAQKASRELFILTQYYNTLIGFLIGITAVSITWAITAIAPPVIAIGLFVVGASLMIIVFVLARSKLQFLKTVIGPPPEEKK